MKFIFAIILFVLSGIIFFFYTQPTYAGVGTTQDQIAQYQQALDKAAQLQSLKQGLLTKYNAFNPTDLSRLSIMLPDHVDNIGLILDLDSLASKYGLALENVDVAASDQSQTGSSVVGATAGNQTYDSLTLHFSTFGTYDNFHSFLVDLEQGLRITDLTNLTLSQQASAPGSYNYDITLKTYWLK